MRLYLYLGSGSLAGMVVWWCGSVAGLVPARWRVVNPISFYKSRASFAREENLNFRVWSVKRKRHLKLSILGFLADKNS